MEPAFQKAAAPAEVTPDPIADLAYGDAVVLLAELAALRAENAEQLAKRDAEIEALRAEMVLKKADTAPDLDGEPRPWLNIKQAAGKLDVCGETNRARLHQPPPRREEDRRPMPRVHS